MTNTPEKPATNEEFVPSPMTSQHLAELGLAPVVEWGPQDAASKREARDADYHEPSL